MFKEHIHSYLTDKIILNKTRLAVNSGFLKKEIINFCSISNKNNKISIKKLRDSAKGFFLHPTNLKKKKKFIP